jgi:excisionase family DNA binding protein
MCFVSAIYEPPNEGLPQFARVKDVARALDVPVRTILDWVDSGRVPAFRVNRTVRIPHSALASIATAAARDAATIDADQSHDEDIEA